MLLRAICIPWNCLFCSKERDSCPNRPKLRRFPCISAMCKTGRNSVLWPIEIVSNLGNTANKLCTV